MRFKREALTVARLQHPNILAVHDYGEQNGLLYLVMPFVERGTTLSDLLDAPLPLAKALRLFRYLLDALDYAHAAAVKTSATTSLWTRAAPLM